MAANTSSATYSHSIAEYPDSSEKSMKRASKTYLKRLFAMKGDQSVLYSTLRFHRIQAVKVGLRCKLTTGRSLEGKKREVKLFTVEIKGENKAVRRELAQNIFRLACKQICRHFTIQAPSSKVLKIFDRKSNYCVTASGHDHGGGDPILSSLRESIALQDARLITEDEASERKKATRQQFPVECPSWQELEAIQSANSDDDASFQKHWDEAWKGIHNWVGDLPNNSPDYPLLKKKQQVLIQRFRANELGISDFTRKWRKLNFLAINTING